MRRAKIVAALGVLFLLGASCSGDGVSLAFGDVPSSVEGNVVELPVDVEGVEIVPADGDTSGDTGHLHVFVDRSPVGAGEVIPVEPRIVHSADNPVVVYGLSVGTHEFTVVLGDGVHSRIGDFSDTITVDVAGPSVQGSVPARIDEGEPLVVSLEAEGVDIVAADGDTSGDSGHFHVLVDPDAPPAAGEIIPDPVEGSIYHSAEDSVTIEGLEAGTRTLWIVLGDGSHRAFDPPVMDRIQVTVG